MVTRPERQLIRIGEISARSTVSRQRFTVLQNFRNNFGWTGTFLILFLGTFPVSAAVLTHGPLVGGVDHQSVKISVRTDVAAEARIQYSTSDGSCAPPQVTAPVVTQQAADFTAIIELTGLCPVTQYFYSVLVDGVPQVLPFSPSFATFPDPTESVPFTFTVLADLRGDNDVPSVPAPAYAKAASENPAFVMQIGDFDHRGPRALKAMRKMHKEVRGAETPSGLDFLNAIACCFPFFHVWDDHDYGPDNGDKTFSRKAEALQAFKEYYPTPPLANPSAGIWHSFRYGQAEFFMLDLRSQRDPNSTVDDATRSMLDGDNIANGQKDWLKNGLLGSTAKWKFLVSSVTFNRNSGKRFDAWMGFLSERTELVDFITSNNISGVIVLSADIHSGGGIDNGSNSDFPEVTVPHTNLDRTGKGTCVGVGCRPIFWSEGIVSGAEVTGGYAVVTVTTNPDQVMLQTKDDNGVIGVEFSVE